MLAVNRAFYVNISLLLDVHQVLFARFSKELRFYILKKHMRFILYRHRFHQGRNNRSDSLPGTAGDILLHNRTAVHPGFR